MLLTVSCIHTARPGHTALMGSRGCPPPGSEITCVCLCVVRMGIHASTQHSNPAAFVFLTYKLQNDPSEKLLPQQTGAPLSPSLLLMGRMCVLCVWMSTACMCKCVCVCEHTGSFSLALEVNRKRRGVFFSQDIREWRTRRKCHTVPDDCFWSFLEKRGSLNLDTEKDSYIVSLQWQITCLDRSVEVSFTAGGQGSSDYHKTWFYSPWEKRSWPPSLFVFLWAWPHRVFDWELRTCYCSQTNEGSEWHTADTGWTPVRITAWTGIWSSHLSSTCCCHGWTGTVCDCFSETHMFSSVPEAETCDVQYVGRAPR